MVMTSAKELEPAKIDMTVRVAAGVKGIAPKKRAPRAIRNLRALAAKTMSTSDVRISPELNTMIWSKGVRYLPTRLRVRFNRKRNSSEDDNSEQFYTVIEYVECGNFKGLSTEHVVDDE